MSKSTKFPKFQKFPKFFSASLFFPSPNPKAFIGAQGLKPFSLVCIYVARWTFSSCTVMCN